MCPKAPLPTQPPELPDADWTDGDEEPIAIQVDEPYQDRVDAADLARAVAAALAAEGRPDGEVTVVITTDSAVQTLNAQYRGLDEPTDVLSFPAQDEAPGFVSAPEAAGYLGDVVIAFPYTEHQATKLERSLRDELRLLAVHGILHLLGYDHEEPAEEAQMWARQETILSSLEP